MFKNKCNDAFTKALILIALTYKRRIYYHIETSQLICSANQLTGFYMMATLAFNQLKTTIQSAMTHVYFMI